MGGGGNAGALSRKTFVDVISGTPSLRGASIRGDESSCDANGAVTSGSALGGASTRVADASNWSTRVFESNWLLDDPSNWFVADPANASTRVADESNWFVAEPSNWFEAEPSNWFEAAPSN